VSRVKRVRRDLRRQLVVNRRLFRNREHGSALPLSPADNGAGTRLKATLNSVQP
jgi:hypothetical protein